MMEKEKKGRQDYGHKVSLGLMNVFRRRKTHLFDVLRPLKSFQALLEISGALNW